MFIIIIFKPVVQQELKDLRRNDDNIWIKIKEFKKNYDEFIRPQ